MRRCGVLVACVLLWISAFPAFAGDLTLLAAGNQIHLYKFSVPDLTEDAASPDGSEYGSWDLSAHPETLEPLIQPIDLPQPVRGIVPDPRGSAVFLNTEAGLIRCEIESIDSETTLRLIPWFTEGAIRAFDVAADGTVYLLDAHEISELSADPQVEIMAIRPDAPGVPIHIAPVSDRASGIKLSPDGRTIWILRQTGRTLARATFDGLGWSVAEFTIPPGPKKLEDPYWAFRTFIPEANGGPLMVEEGRGTIPRILQIAPDESIHELYAWKRGIFIRSASYWDGGTADRELIINAATEVILLDLDNRIETRIESPRHIHTLAVSPDRRAIAVSLAIDTSHSRIDILHLDVPRRLESTLIEDKIQALAFVSTR